MPLISKSARLFTTYASRFGAQRPQAAHQLSTSSPSSQLLRTQRPAQARSYHSSKPRQAASYENYRTHSYAPPSHKKPWTNRRIAFWGVIALTQLVIPALQFRELSKWKVQVEKLSPQRREELGFIFEDERGVWEDQNPLGKYNILFQQMRKMTNTDMRKLLAKELE